MRPLHSSEFFSQPRRFSHAIPGLQTLRIFNLTEGLRPQTQTPAPRKPKSSDREQSRHSTHLPSRNTRPSKSRQTLACYSQSELLPSVTTHRLRLIAGHSIVVPAHQSPHQLICRHSVVVPARQSPHPTHLQSCAHQSSSVSQQASSFRATQLSPKAFLQSPTKACRAQHLLSQTQTSTSSKPKSSDPNQSRQSTHLPEISRAHTAASHSAAHQNKQASSVRAQRHAVSAHNQDFGGEESSDSGSLQAIA